MTTSQIRAECRKYAEKYVDLQRADFKRLGILGQWEDPYLTMSAAIRSGDRGRVRRFSRPRLRLQRPEAGELVHARSHRAGRSRGRIRESHQPVHLGSFRADVGPGRNRSRARRTQRLRRSSGPPRPGPSRPTSPSRITRSSNTSRWKWTARFTSSRWSLLKVTAEKLRLGPTRKPSPRFPARSSKAPSSAIHFSIAIRSASLPITSRWSKAPARFTPLPATARRTT